jgi:transposase
MSKQAPVFSVVHPHAAGIDVGSRSHWASVGEGIEYVREFGVFTQDTHEMIAWLEQHGVKTIAMESTGFYWKPLFLMLQAHGFEVYLVNAGHVKNAKGKKSDVLDCQWLWQLHSVGLLQASFQPSDFTEELRTYSRHRRKLVEGASRQVAKMQKALTVMNIHLPVVLSDITGKSGQDIIGAILKGERDGRKMAHLADPRVKADTETIAKALTGKWQPQHLFELRQGWDMYQFHQKQIAECDACMEKLLQEKVEQTGQAELVYGPEKKSPAVKRTSGSIRQSTPTSSVTGWT